MNSKRKKQKIKLVRVEMDRRIQSARDDLMYANNDSSHRNWMAVRGRASKAAAMCQKIMLDAMELERLVDES